MLSQAIKKKELFLEGCLSVPGYYAFIDRPFSVKAKWQDLKGKTHEEKFEHRESAYIQHEIDHLDGILFIDRLSRVKKRIVTQKFNRKLKELREDEESTER